MVQVFEKRVISVFVLLLISVIYLPFAGADIISVNSGGGTEAIITTGGYIEGFFFGIPSPPPVEEESDSSSSSSSSSTTGTTGTTGTTASLSLDPTTITLNLEINTTQRRTIKVTNTGTSSATVSVTQQNLGERIILGSTSLTIPVGETALLNVTFAALDSVGTYAGKIIIGGREVLVTLNVFEGFLLFDSNIVVLNKDYSVEQGGQIETLVTLIPMGDPQRLDVTLNYRVMDYRNKIYFTRSETVLSEEQAVIKRDFDTGILPSGDYIVALELVYPNGVAPSSAHFIVVGREVPEFLGSVILVLIILILLVSITIVTILVVRKMKESFRESRDFAIYT